MCKEAVVAEVLERRGDHPGLVHVISAMEACSAYKPWHDKQTHKTYLRPDGGKCLHHYFYFMDAELGLIHARVPTWAPFRLRFYCNGHGWLARRLAAEGGGFATADNAFVRIDDWPRAQVDPERQGRAGRQLSEPQDHPATGPGSRLPVLHPHRRNLHQASLRQRLDQDVRQIRPHTAHRNHVKRRVLLQAPPKSGTSKRTRRSPARPGQEEHLQPDRPARDHARLQPPLSGTPLGLDDTSAGVRALDRITKPRSIDGKTVKGVNFFDPIDKSLLHAPQNPRVNIAGVRRADLVPTAGLSPSRFSRQLRRLRNIGVIKRVAGTYRYYLTRIGRAAIAALCRLTQGTIIPALA
jgi:hypothetical protein